MISLPSDRYAGRLRGQGEEALNADVEVNQVRVIIDSGGVLGTMPSYVIGNSQLSGNLPAETLISVYSGDGQTLLYSYKTDGLNTPSVMLAQLGMGF